MDAAVGTDERWQRVGVGAAQLLDLPVTQQRLDDGVVLRHLLQRVGVGRRTGLRLPDRREPEVLEQDLAQLRRGVDVELLPRMRVDLGFEPAALVVQLLAQVMEEVEVDADARLLHAREHAHERTLDPLVEVDQLARTQCFLECGRERQQQRSATLRLVDARVAVEVERALHPVGRGELDREVAERKVFERVLPLAGIE